jgi:hypothetical protein
VRLSIFPNELPPRPTTQPGISLRNLSSHHHIDLQIGLLEVADRPQRHFIPWRHKASDLAEVVDAFAQRTPAAMTTRQANVWADYITRKYSLVRSTTWEAATQAT